MTMSWPILARGLVENYPVGRRDYPMLPVNPCRMFLPGGRFVKRAAFQEKFDSLGCRGLFRLLAAPLPPSLW